MKNIEYGTEFLDQLKDSVHDLYDENKELKDRISKAIEYIEEWQKFPHTNGTTHEELRNLKGILKGVDKDV